MKILFAMSSPEYLRFYDSTIVELAGRGHTLLIAVNALRDAKPVRPETIERLHPQVAFVGVVPPRGDGWMDLARAVRGTMDFVRYLDPRLAAMSALRARMKRQALPWVLQGIDRVRSLPAATVARMMRALAALERAIPVGRRLLQYVDEHAPDLVLVSPLVEAASDQVDLVRAAQARGIPVGTLVASWDNLTNKGDLRVPGDFVVVWNQSQKQEAIELHRVPPEDIVVTGSQVFDRWFDRRPSQSREAFCRLVGLPANKPFVLYTGSSIFISRAHVEVPFVQRWIAALRDSGDRALRDIAVLVRPHPYNGSAWPDLDLASLGDVAVWPKGGYNPVDDTNRDAFFDSLYYSEAVVGINTSAMIEAAIVGRPVLSIRAPEFAKSQEGTVHFQYLLRENGGFVRVASSFDEHAGQLADILREPASVRSEIDRFVASFVRPHGIERPCVPILVDALERHGRTSRPTARTASWGALAMRAVLLPMAPLARWCQPAASRKRAGAPRWRNAPPARQVLHAAGTAARRLRGVESK